jgi:hypothetical protein
VFRERIQTVDNLKKKEMEWRGEMRVLFREGICRSFVIYMLFVSLYLGCGQGCVEMRCNIKECKKFCGEFYVFEPRHKEWKINFSCLELSPGLWLNRNDLIFNSNIISTLVH